MKFLILLSLFTTACTTAPKCPDGAMTKTVFREPPKCEVRIRKVTIGTETPLPNSLRDGSRFDSDIVWAPAKFENGRLETGHFVVTPKSKEAANAK